MENAVVNVSIEIDNDNGRPIQSIVQAVTRALESGRIVVVAAGNGGPCAGSMSRLATLPGVISVGASDFDGTRVATFSSRGWPMAPNSGPTVIAPGENIITEWKGSVQKTAEREQADEQFITLETLRHQTGEDYSGQNLAVIRKSLTVISGTSFSSAYVSGLMVKFVELRRHLGLPHRSEHALEFLRRVAKRIHGYGNHEQGYGFVSNDIIQEHLKVINLGDPFWVGNWSPTR